MMEQRQNTHVYPSHLTGLLSVSAYQQNVDRLSLVEGSVDRLSVSDGNADGYTDGNGDGYADGNGDGYADGNGDGYVDKFGEPGGRCSSPASTLDDADSSHSAFGVDLTGKATHFSGKSFTIAAILGLTSAEEDAMTLRVQERLQSQRQLQNYLYSQDYCRGVQALAQDCPRTETRTSVAQMKISRAHPMTCSNAVAVAGGGGRSKRIRTIFTPEQLERLEAEFERQQYMVGPERLYLAHALQLTEAQVKVWFQNRRIKWRKHHLEVTQQRLAVLQRHQPEPDDDM